MTASGNISGTGNISLTVMNMNAGSSIRLSGASINNTGAITNNGNSSVATTATISGNIGANVTGTDSNNKAVNGVATQALLQNGAAYVAVGSSLVPLANITAVAPVSAS